MSRVAAVPHGRRTARSLETLGTAQVLGVGLAAAGALAFTGDKLLAADWQATGGDLTLLIAAALFSYYTVASKPLIERHGGVTVLAYGTLIGTLPTLLYCAPTLSKVGNGTLSFLTPNPYAGLTQVQAGIPGIQNQTSIGTAGQLLERRLRRRHNLHGKTQQPGRSCHFAGKKQIPAQEQPLGSD